LWVRSSTNTAQRCRSKTETFILEDLSSSVLSQFKKYHPSGNLKFNDLGIFLSLKLRILVGKILPISLNLNITPNTLGCYGLKLAQYRRISVMILLKIDQVAKLSKCYHQTLVSYGSS